MQPDQDPASSGTGDPPPDNSGTGTGAGSSDGGSGDSGGQQGQEPTLTQDQVNAIVAREVSKAQRGKLDPKDLGFESGAQLKEFLDKQKAAVEEAKTQAEKDLEEAKTAARTEAEARVLSKANERFLKAAFLTAATKADVASPDDAYVLAKTMDIWGQVELVEDGDDVSVTGFDDNFFKVLKEQKSFLFAEPNNGQQAGGRDLGGGAGGAGRGGQDTTDQLYKDYPALPRPAGTPRT